jgi:hypothetical protein
MTPFEELTHERCSELLAAYVGEGLEAAGSEAVARHLASCPDCRQELNGLSELLAPAGPPMTSSERAALHEALPGPTGDARVVDFRPRSKRREPISRPWPARLAAALGAAALLLVVAAAAVLLPRNASQQGAEGSGGSSAEAPEVGPMPSAQRGDESTKDSRGLAERLDAQRPGRRARPLWVSPTAPTTRAQLERRGRRGQPFVAFAQTLSSTDATARQAEFLNQLAARAPASLRPAVRSCTARVERHASAGYRLLPAFGARAKLDGDQVLVLGYAWTQGKGPLDRFMIWGFARGSCDAPVIYEAGPIRP